MEERDTQKAFLWILDILKSHNIPCIFLGGFAAKIYGCKRELADIDVSIPESKFNEILPEIEKYIIFGPERYLDENWNLQLITLKYENQEIDIWSDKAKIRGSEKEKWNDLIMDFNNFETKEIYGRNIPVIKKEVLIDYKKILKRDVDFEDIKQIN